MGVASLTPALPIISTALDLTKAEVALLISAFTFPGILLTPVAGLLADRWGRKAVLVPSLFIFAMGGSAIFFVREFQMMIPLRVLQGIGAASLGALNTTLIGDFYKGRDLPAVMGYNSSVLSLSTATYPLIGGLLAGMAWHWPFILPSLGIPAAVYIWIFLPEPEIERSPDFLSYIRAASRSILRREVLSVFALGVLTFVILYGAFLTFLPFLLRQTFDLSPPQIGVIFSLSSLTTALLSSRIGRLTEQFGSLKLLKTAFILYAAVTLMMPHIEDLRLFAVPILLFGSAQALNIPSLMTLLSRLAPSEQRAVFMSLFGMVLRIGQTLGPLIVGIGFAFGGLDAAFYLTSGVALFGLIILFNVRFKQ